MKQESEDKLNRVLEALENPSSFTKKELEELFSDEDCLNSARDILRAREVLARQNMKAPDVEKEWNKFKNRNKRNYVVSVIAGLAAACILLLFIINSPARQDKGLKVFESLNVSQNIEQDTVNGIVSIVVPRGMQKELSLPDGTIVKLNADSRLAYDISQFGKTERKVILEGEGLFDVSKDSLHMFVVQSGGLETCVLGTVFNVRNYNTEKMKITLLSGSLKVVSSSEEESIYIKPGEQAVLINDNELCSVKVSQTDNISSWSEGVFYFDNQTLSEILCEIGRWYNVNVIFEDKNSMDNCLHFKALRSESLGSIVDLLNSVSKKTITLKEKTLFVGK